MTNSPTVETANVSFDCPKCHKTARVASLGRHSSIVNSNGPFTATLTGTLWGMITGEKQVLPVNAATETVACPCCRKNVLWKDVINLQGEMLFDCPHCQHPMKTPSLAVNQVICCEMCGKGSTAGYLELKEGTLLDPQPTSPPQQLTGLALRVRCTCTQNTNIHEYGSGKNEIHNHALQKEHAFLLPDPVDRGGTHEHTCPHCNSSMTITLQCENDRAAQVEKQAKVARYASWAVAALPLIVLFFVVRYAMGAYADGDTSFPTVDVVLFGVALVLVLTGCWSIPLLFAGHRQKLLDPVHRFSTNSKQVDENLWRTTSTWTKVATLELKHAFVIERVNA